jgi:hypothetical protein
LRLKTPPVFRATDFSQYLSAHLFVHILVKLRPNKKAAGFPQRLLNIQNFEND